MMNKTMWARPNAKLEEFAANEYVAVCFAVRCAVVKTQDGTWYYDDNSLPHAANSDETGCGWAKNQYITGNNTDGYTLVELGKNTLAITITDKDYSAESKHSTLSSTEAEAGNTIYWITEQDTEEGTTNVYHHYGTIESTYTGHPNRS